MRENPNVVVPLWYQLRGVVEGPRTRLDIDFEVVPIYEDSMKPVYHAIADRVFAGLTYQCRRETVDVFLSADDRAQACGSGKIELTYGEIRVNDVEVNDG